MKNDTRETGKKKILYVITKSEPFGGAQRYVMDLATGISKEKYEVVVACGGMGTLYKKLTEAGIRTYSLSSLERDIAVQKELRSLCELIRLFKEERPDVVHLSSSKVAGLGALAGLFARVPNIVFTVHGWPFMEDRTVFEKYLIRFFSWLSALFAHRVIVLSDHDLMIGRKMAFIKKKFALVRNGIAPFDLFDKKSARDFIRAECTLSPESDVVWIGTISELTKNKGLSFAILACASLYSESKKFLFFIMGEGEERKTLERLIKEKGLEKKVYLLGFVPNARQYLSAFDIVTQTSIKEGLPYAILEAGYAGRALVASAVGGIPDIVEDMKSGMLVQPKRGAEIALALRYLIESSTKRDEFGENLRKTVDEHFQVKTMLNQTLAIYEKRNAKQV